MHRRMFFTAASAGILGIGFWSLRFRGLPGWSSLWRYSAATVAVAAGLWFLLYNSVESRSLTGLWQRLFIGTLHVWCMVVGLHAFRSARREQRAET